MHTHLCTTVVEEMQVACSKVHAMTKGKAFAHAATRSLDAPASPPGV